MTSVSNPFGNSFLRCTFITLGTDLLTRQVDPSDLEDLCFDYEPYLGWYTDFVVAPDGFARLFNLGLLDPR